jgi:hypothetical protein
MAEVPGSLEHRFDLFLAQDDGKFFLIPGQRNPFDLDLPVQGVAVEEPEPADGLNVGRDLYSLISEQV